MKLECLTMGEIPSPFLCSSNEKFSLPNEKAFKIHASMLIL